MRNKKLIINLIVILMLVMTVPGNTSMVAGAGIDKSDPRVDPYLLQLVRDHPDDFFRVIVQKDSREKNPELDVAAGGGRVIKHLDLIDSFSAEITGKEVLKLAGHKGVLWVSSDAPVFLAGGFDSNTYTDNFNGPVYTGTNGTQPWDSRPWVEAGESDGVSAGKLMVIASSKCAAGNCLRLGGSNTSLTGRSISRAVPLGLVTSATLTFKTRAQATTSTSGTVSVQVSSNNGATWVTLQTFSIKTSDSGPVARTYDISAYTSVLTKVRFLGSGTVNGYLHVDDVQIEYSRLANSYIRSVLANNVWMNNPAPGEGVTVAVVDGGMANHLDLTTNSVSRILASVDFTRDINFTYSKESMATEAMQSYPSLGLENQAMMALPTGEEIPLESIGYDDYGHGTHVAGIIGGMGQASQGARVGNAPAVSLINVKVTGADGSGYLSDMIYGLQWIYENRDMYNIRVVNISMNSALPESYHTSPVDAAVEILWFNGIVVVVAAGNNGNGTAPVALLPPANDPFVITVGATDDIGTPWLLDDAMATFSAYGTTENGFAKPDLVAPGRNIISLLASTNSRVYIDHPDHRVDDNYFRMSGTSMAAPMVTGAVALILQRNPNLNPDQVKYRLISTANQNWPGYNATKAGSGYLNTMAAVMGTSTQTANTGIAPSQMLTTGNDPITWGSVGWNSVGWNSVGWNSVGWNSVGWNSVGWNSVGWNTSIWDN
jgi:serine protease AprX